MLKLIGFLIIMISSTKIGFDYSLKYTSRTEQLKAFVFILERLKAEIKLSNSVIADALDKSNDVQEHNVHIMIEYICNMVKKENCSLISAFKSYLVTDEALSLSKEDLDVLSDFFSMLGTGDVDDEIKNIDSAMEKINLLLQDSCEKESKYVKLFRTSGVLAGCLISVILA